MTQLRGLAAVPADTFSVAPMMDYTDRHLRFLLRLLSKRATLYTEMVVSNTLVHNDELDRWLAFNPEEHPLVLQLGGNSPSALRVAVEKAVPYGYREFNLNCGCPSDKVSGKGCFGAALMKDPAHVADLAAAMAVALPPSPPPQAPPLLSASPPSSSFSSSSSSAQAASTLPPLLSRPPPDTAESPMEVTVKCRVGVVSREDMAAQLDTDEEADFERLARFVDTVSTKGGVNHFQVHARKAVLGGLSPDANRKIPPLKPQFVHRLSREFPHLRFTLNGGLESIAQCKQHLSDSEGQGQGVHGVMLGRAVVARPWHLMSQVDEHLYGEAYRPLLTRRWVLERYGAYGEAELAVARVEQPHYVRKLRRAVLRHAANLFAGEPKGAKFRQVIDNELQADNIDPMCPMGCALILERASAVLNPETLDAPPPPLETLPAP